MRRWMIIAYLAFTFPVMLTVTLDLVNVIGFALLPHPQMKAWGGWQPTLFEASLINFSFILFFLHYAALFFSFWLRALQGARTLIYFMGAFAVNGAFLYSDIIPRDPPDPDPMVNLTIIVVYLYLGATGLALIYALWAGWQAQAGEERSR